VGRRYRERLRPLILHLRKFDVYVPFSVVYVYAKRVSCFRQRRSRVRVTGRAGIVWAFVVNDPARLSTDASRERSDDATILQHVGNPRCLETSLPLSPIPSLTRLLSAARK